MAIDPDRPPETVTVLPKSEVKRLFSYIKEENAKRKAILRELEAEAADRGAPSTSRPCPKLDK